MVQTIFRQEPERPTDTARDTRRLSVLMPNRRLCINIIPCVTVWIAAHDGIEPGENRTSTNR